MEAELAGLLEQVQAVRERARRLLDGLDEATFQWRPHPGVWSIADCIAHLNVVAKLFFDVIDRGLERPVRGQGPFGYGRLERWFLRSMEPPVTRKVRAPRKFRPGSVARLDVALAEFLANQDRMEERIRQADGLDLARTKVASPVTSLIHYSLGIALQVMVSHERRHLWQAEQVRAHAQFPRTQTQKR
jgi:hypothetical protein